MGVNSYKIKKWIAMITGNSILHVNQDLGKAFDPLSVKGYFNNLTEKVTRLPELLATSELPMTYIDTGEKIVFPVTIFQYGLGAYDLYLLTHDEKYLTKFFQCVEWAVYTQKNNGSWENFKQVYPDHPYGAMCQGEAASLLVRAYVQTKKQDYLDHARDALYFMIRPVTKGGTLLEDNDNLILLEFTHKPAVLNGWVFALFGLYDYLLIKEDKELKQKYENTLNTLAIVLPKFNCRFWSMYDLDGHIASPFYHKLHIAQMEALYLISQDNIFNNLRDKWISDQRNPLKRILAFCIKSIQKILER